MNNAKLINFKCEDPTTSYHLYQLIKRYVIDKNELIILCIGTDRCTGDSLGPLVGSYLTERSPTSFFVYGTLDEPVHAKNLNETIEHIYNHFQNPYIIAIDACLSSIEKVNTIDAGVGYLKPGAALSKKLNPVGDFFIKGNVNISSSMNLAVLQSTRLSKVIKLSRIIGRALHYLDLELKKYHLKQIEHLS